MAHEDAVCSMWDQARRASKEHKLRDLEQKEPLQFLAHVKRFCVECPARGRGLQRYKYDWATLIETETSGIRSSLDVRRKPHTLEDYVDHWMMQKCPKRRLTRDVATAKFWRDVKDKNILTSYIFALDAQGFETREEIPQVWLALDAEMCDTDYKDKNTSVNKGTKVPWMCLV
jgi:hypothetical protein